MKKNRLAERISLINIACNGLLAISKITIGITASSSALVSDGVNNATDVISNVIVIIGVSMSQKASDNEHQYGHEKLECLASIILGLLFIVVGVSLGFEGIKAIVTGSYKNFPRPEMMAVVMAVISIIVKLLMYIYNHAGAVKLNSSALRASASDCLSDVLATSGGIIGILGARLGFLPADSLASVVISVFVIRLGIKVFQDGTDKMVDHALPTQTIQKIGETIEHINGVRALDDIKTREFGARAYVDVEIACDGNLRLYQAHAVAQKVHDVIEKEFPEVKHCMVHVNPYKHEESTSLPDEKPV
ncbi:MAG: cation diffusion facilitator family transporter [Sphaerochaetaceae bacterium]